MLLVGEIMKMSMILKQTGFIIFIVHLRLPFGFGFNLDERTFVERRGERNSQFGFSVAQYVDNSTGISSLLVGAPSMQTGQEGVFKGGAVLRCPLDRSDCSQVPFDEQGNSREWNGRDRVQIENKTLQWFGATLVTSKYGHVLACAPRYVHFSPNGLERQPVGSCYLSQSNWNLQSFVKFSSPCINTKGDDCQNGFSAVFSSDGKYFLTGAVGSFFWQGQVFLKDLGAINDPPLSSAERPVSEDNTYMGYAVASVNFGLVNNQGFVVGIPKGNHLTGKIVFLNATLDSLYELTGEQIGEYFGTSLAVADFDGDGRDDVAVGAPFYSPNRNQYDVGRVYVFYQMNRFTQSKVTRLTTASRKPLGRFGLALSQIGDLNLDGYQDLVVGAPYDGPNSNGAVYVFMGSSSGVRTKETQICFAETFGPQLSSFGFSLSGGLDLDKNEYPDLVIGTHRSDSVVYLRSRPVVKVIAKVKVIPEMINLNDRRCRLRDNTPVACFEISFCANYSGVKVPSQLQLKLTWLLDTWKTRNQRVAFISDSHSESMVTINTTIATRRDREECTKMNAYVKEKIRDKLSPIEVSVGYSLMENVSKVRELRPILDIFSRNPVAAEGHIQKNCGEDRICVPNLKLQISSAKSHYVLGTSDEVNLNVVVKNFAEDAFESFAKIDLPEGVSYINVVNMTGSTEIVCDSFRPENSSTDGVFCDIGNPVPANETISFVIRTIASRASEQTTVLRFSVLVNSSNPENVNSFDDNFKDFDVPVKAILNIMLAGVSQPQQVLYNDYEDKPVISGSDIGPNVSHLFEIRNFGPGIVGSIRMVVKWPSMNYDNLHLFYLLEHPQVILGNGRCWTDVVNPLNISNLHTFSPDRGSDLTSDVDEPKLRIKRELATSDARVQKVSCSDEMSQCSTVTCEAGPMKKDDSVLIQIRARIFYRTISEMHKKNSRGNGILVESEASAIVTSVPYAVKPEVHMTKKVLVETFVSLKVDQMQSPVEIWMIAVGIFVGCVLLFALVIILWRCGFFERAIRLQMQRGQVRYESVEEEQSAATD